MAKELPYFKFEPAEYLTKDISFCSLSAQGLFINICSYYWQRNCELTKEQLLRRLNHETELNELIKEGVIDLVGNKILIKFLDNQLNEVENKSKTNSANGSKGGRPKKNQTKSETKPNLNPTESESISESKGIREEKIKEQNINNILMSEIKISDDKKFLIFDNEQIETSENDVLCFSIAEGFRKLFIKNLKEKNAPTNHQEKASYKDYTSPIRLMLEKKEASKLQIEEAYRFLNSDEGEFWKSNILSTKKLREKITQILAKKNTKKQNELKPNILIPDPNKRNRFV